MRNHVLTYTGKKPHIFLECVNRFTHAGDVKKHLLANTADNQSINQFISGKYKYIMLQFHSLIIVISKLIYNPQEYP